MSQELDGTNGIKEDIPKDTPLQKPTDDDGKGLSMKKNREKSVRYPYYSLEDCVQYLSTLHKIGGRKGAQVGSILSEMKITSIANRRYTYLTSSSEIFGLIVKSDQMLKPTDLGILILFPTNAAQRKQLLMNSFNLPEIYTNIIQKYNETILPNRELLRSEFYHLGIAQNALDDAVDSFLNSAKYVGALDENNRLVIPSDGEESEYYSPPVKEKVAADNFPLEKDDRRNPSILKQNEEKNPLINQADDIVRFEVLTSTGLKATVSLPSKCTHDDIEKIKRIVSAYGPG